MTATRIELLQGMPIFGALREDTLAFLLGLMHERHVQAGGWFFRQGDTAAEIYVLEHGEARVLREWQGREVPLGQLRAGDCFGEMALMDLMPRSAAVRATTDCSALVLSGDDLYRLCRHDIEQFALLQMNLGRELSRRLRQADDELFRLRQAG